VPNWDDFFKPYVNFSKSKHYKVKTFETTSIKFHVPSLPKWQKVLFMFRNIGRSITDENCFHFLLSKHCSSKHCSFTKISSKFLSSIIFCKNFAIRNKMQNPVKYNVLYAVGVWPTHLFVAGSIILLQCLSTIHKAGTNLRNDEIWRLLLLEQIPTFGELDKIGIMSNRWKKKVHLTFVAARDRSEINFLKITYTWCRTEMIFSILTHVNLSKSMHYLVKTFEKHLLNFMFLVSPNDIRF